MARYELTGKVALVTGGARGIGFATARALLARGASVTLLDLDQGAAARAAGELHDTRALGIGGDVSDRGSMQRAVATTVDRYGGLDVLVANAGVISRIASLRAMSSESFERVIEVNVMGVYRSIEAALPEIVPRRGHVVAISSVYAFLNGAGAVSYAMSKAAVEQLGRALRVELAPYGASASVAYFGFIDTEMVHRALDADPLVAQMLQTLPRPLQKRIPASAAGEAIAQGIERRRPRIIRPRRWTLMALGRGVLGPLSDSRLERDPRAQAFVREVDARAGEDQPLTA